jgi:nitrite reductase (NO-forming)
VPALARVTARGLRFDPTDLEIRAGVNELELANRDSREHTLVISELAVAILAGAGQTVRSTVVVHRRNRGRFPFFCSIPGHREAGMEGMIEVR